MSYDATKPNLSQTYGDAINSANANDVDISTRVEAHKSDSSAHGLAAVLTSIADYLIHKANITDAHGIDAIMANVASLVTEVTAGRGTQSSLTGRLNTALNGDGSIRLSTLNNKWINNSDTPTYISTTSFSVPGDRTKVYIAGVQLRFTISGSYAYGPVASCSYSGGITTVVIDPAYPVLTSGLSVIDIGLIAWDNSVANSCTTNAANIASVQGQVTSLKIEQINSWLAGKPPISVSLVRFLAGQSFSIPSGLTGSCAYAGVAATATTVFTILKNGTVFGTMTFAAGSHVATWAAATATSFVLGDLLMVVAPGVQDTTLADISLVVIGVLP
jgi:hypothetical protein